MPFTTGPIENTGNQPANANRVRVKVLNRSGGTLTGLIRVFRLNGTRVLLSQANFSVAANASAVHTLNLTGTVLQYEVEIIPNFAGGLYSVYGLTPANIVIPAQRIVHSELTRVF